MKSIKVCGRCGIVEKRGRVFENVSTFQLCVDCAQIVYKAKDALSDGDVVTANAMFKGFKNGVIESPSKHTVVVWAEEFAQTTAQKHITDLEKSFNEFLIKNGTFANGRMPKATARLYLDLIGVVEGTSPFEFNAKQLEQAQKKYKYIDLAEDYWRA